MQQHASLHNKKFEDAMNLIPICYAKGIIIQDDNSNSKSLSCNSGASDVTDSGNSIEKCSQSFPFDKINQTDDF